MTPSKYLITISIFVLIFAILAPIADMPSAFLFFFFLVFGVIWLAGHCAIYSIGWVAGRIFGREFTIRKICSALSKTLAALIVLISLFFPVCHDCGSIFYSIKKSIVQRAEKRQLEDEAIALNISEITPLHWKGIDGPIGYNVKIDTQSVRKMCGHFISPLLATQISDALTVDDPNEQRKLYHDESSGALVGYSYFKPLYAEGAYSQSSISSLAGFDLYPSILYSFVPNQRICLHKNYSLKNNLSHEHVVGLLYCHASYPLDIGKQWTMALRKTLPENSAAELRAMADRLSPDSLRKAGYYTCDSNGLDANCFCYSNTQ